MSTQPGVTQETLPISALRDNPSAMIERLKTTHRTIVLTVDGKPEAVLQDPGEYQRLLDLGAEADASEGIRQGLEQLHRGEGRSATEFFAELREKHGLQG